MPYFKTLRFGILLWVIMFALASLLLAHDYLYTLRGELTLLLISVALALYFANLLKPNNLTRALIIGVSWGIIGTGLDLLITRPLAKASPIDFMTQWHYWLSYLLIILAPAFRIKSAPELKSYQNFF